MRQKNKRLHKRLELVEEINRKNKLLADRNTKLIEEIKKDIGRWEDKR